MADADLKRVGQIRGTGGSWTAGATAQDGYRALFTLYLSEGNAAGALNSLERMMAADDRRRHLHLVKDTLEAGG